MNKISNFGVQLALTYSGGEIASCPESNHSYDPEFDDERSIIGDGCEILAASSALTFLVIAFGEDLGSEGDHHQGQVGHQDVSTLS